MIRTWYPHRVPGPRCLTISRTVGHCEGRQGRAAHWGYSGPGLGIVLGPRPRVPSLVPGRTPVPGDQPVPVGPPVVPMIAHVPPGVRVLVADHPLKRVVARRTPHRLGHARKHPPAARHIGSPAEQGPIRPLDGRLRQPGGGPTDVIPARAGCGQGPARFRSDSRTKASARRCSACPPGLPQQSSHRPSLMPSAPYEPKCSDPLDRIFDCSATDTHQLLVPLIFHPVSRLPSPDSRRGAAGSTTYRPTCPGPGRGRRGSCAAAGSGPDGVDVR